MQTFNTMTIELDLCAYNRLQSFTDGMRTQCEGNATAVEHAVEHDVEHAVDGIKKPPLKEV
jgi:hypothetical protein